MTLSYEIGLAAGACFVIAFGLLNFGVLKSTSSTYQVLNLLGALGFTYTALSPFNPGLFITEVVWAVVAIFGIWKILSKGSSKKAKEVTPATPENATK